MVLIVIWKPTCSICSDVMHEVGGNSISWYFPYGKIYLPHVFYPYLKLVELFFIVKHLAGNRANGKLGQVCESGNIIWQQSFWMGSM